MIKWEGTEVPFKERHLLAEGEVLELLYAAIGELEVILQAEDRHAKILDADYSKVDIPAYVNTLVYLNTVQIDELGKMLLTFPRLFGGSLGTLNIPPIDLELKEGAKP